MYFPSRLHIQVPIGRFVSVVNSLAELNGSSVFLTHKFRVFFHGLMNARYSPSGETCAPVISGFPNNSSRSISTCAEEPCAPSVEARGASSKIVENSFFVVILRIFSGESPLQFRVTRRKVCSSN